MTLPRVTAIVPSFNHELWVQNALFSLVNQNYPNLKIVCIDDGSTDYTWSKIKEICSKLQNFPLKSEQEPVELMGGYIKNIPIIIARFSKNYGPSTSRNYGIKTAWNDTDLYAFLDSDDEYLPEKIEKSIEPFIKYGDNLVGIVYSDFETLNVQTGRICREFKPPYNRQHLMRECIINCNSLVSKKLFERADLFPEMIKTCEDFDTWLRISEKSVCIHIPENLIRIRVGKHSTTNSISKDQWERNYSIVMQRLAERMNA